MRHRRDRRRTCGDRSRAGRGAPRHGHGLLHGESGQCRKHAVQPGHRRNGEGTSGPGTGRAGRRDGKGGGQGLHPVPDAEPGERSGGPFSAGAGGPAALPGGHETDPGAPGESARQAGGGRGHRDRRRCGPRRRDGHGRHLCLQGGHHRHGDLPGRPHHRGAIAALLRSGRTCGRGAAGGAAAGDGPVDAPLQDGNAAPRPRKDGGFFENGAAEGG